MRMRKPVYAVVDEEGEIIAIYGSKVAARKRVCLHNRNRKPKEMEWFVRSMPVNG